MSGRERGTRTLHDRDPATADQVADRISPVPGYAAGGKRVL